MHGACRAAVGLSGLTGGRGREAVTLASGVIIPTVPTGSVGRVEVSQVSAVRLVFGLGRQRALRVHAVISSVVALVLVKATSATSPSRIS